MALEPNGFLAYEAIVLLDQLAPDNPRVHRLRNLFALFFNGFGDMDPDDAVDVTDG
jgi:hypothetical protein